MIQDRVRRVWGGSRTPPRWEIRPPILFAVLMFGIWVKAEVVFGGGMLHAWGGAWHFVRWFGDLRVGHLDTLRWAATGLYCLVCAAGCVLEVRPVRLDPVPRRPIVLAVALLVCAAATVVPWTMGPGASAEEFVEGAGELLDGGWLDDSFRFAVQQEMPGAIDAARERLQAEDPVTGARAAAVLYEFGHHDEEVRRALRRRLDEATEELARLDRDGNRDEAARLWWHLDGVRSLIEGTAGDPTPGWLRMRFASQDPPVDELLEWWRENRERIAGPRD